MKKEKSPDKTVQRLTLTGICAAAALAVSFFEHILTAALPLPPGVKPGLSNIVVMFVCFSLGLPSALAVAAIKSGFICLMSGALSGFISFCGGALSVLTMRLCFRAFKNRLSYMGISILSAAAHNAGQLAASSLSVGSSLYLAYAPVLLASGIIFGSVTGIILNTVMPALLRTPFYKEVNTTEK